MSSTNASNAPIVDHGPELAAAPWPRADDPKQSYLDTSNGIPSPRFSQQHKPESSYGYSTYDARTTQLPPPSEPSHDDSKKVLFGFSIIGWSALLIALTATVVGGAVGGGVGSALSSCHSDKSALTTQLASCPGGSLSDTSCAPSVSIALATATVTVSATAPSGTNPGSVVPVTPIDYANFTVTDAGTITDIYTGCPALNGSSYTSSRGDSFAIYCATDSGYGSSALEGGTIQVFAGFISYTLDDCMEACSAFNAFSKRNNIEEMVCRSITFNHKMADSVSKNGNVNCWIKNGTVAASGLGASGDTVSCMMS
jgi:hypothetical protein